MEVGTGTCSALANRLVSCSLVYLADDSVGGRDDRFPQWWVHIAQATG